MKLAEGIASILQDFETRQLKIDEVEKLEVVEEEDHEFQPEEDCAEITTPLTSKGTITFSGGQTLCRLVLGDRPIHVTLQRALGSLNFWQKIKFFWHVAMSHNASITPEEVEKCKQRDLLEQLLAEMAGDFPKLTKARLPAFLIQCWAYYNVFLLSQIFVDERDAYMTHALHSLLQKNTFEKRLSWERTDVEWQPLRVISLLYFIYCGCR
ncbi:unnamed protein product [Heligmosomoides polygyrus]|uniref:Rab3 GTPase-activating protein catalytic subunit n=1 Tax=Heligmosomoides polygyrus TaxID=6339 RepID=A0A183FNR3_HELPZ|nr:unnamed protein product [Heligmosomoides polygyrus]